MFFFLLVRHVCALPLHASKPRPPRCRHSLVYLPFPFACAVVYTCSRTCYLQSIVYFCFLFIKLFFFLQITLNSYRQTNNNNNSNNINNTLYMQIDHSQHQMNTSSIFHVNCLPFGYAISRRVYIRLS